LSDFSQTFSVAGAPRQAPLNAAAGPCQRHAARGQSFRALFILGVNEVFFLGLLGKMPFFGSIEKS
jgi:hypothetical protein